MSPSPRFWNRIANRYARQAITDEASYQRKLEASVTGAGFCIEENWQPARNQGVLIIARKPA